MGDVFCRRAGDEALTAMDQQTFDIVVTDMRMPGMDGAQCEGSAETVAATWRMVLSGQSDRQTICARSIRLVSLFPSLAKAKIEVPARPYFCARRPAAESSPAGTLTKLDYLSGLPDIYLQLNQELSCGEPSLQRIDELIRADMAMTAKGLKLVNSASFACHAKSRVLSTRSSCWVWRHCARWY